MKFKQKVSFVLAIILIITNIIFGFVWLPGFYYMQKSLAIFSILVILFFIPEKYEKEDNDFSKNVQEIVYDEEEDEVEIELELEQDEVDNEFLYEEDEEVSTKASEKLKKSLNHKAKLFSIIERIELEELLIDESELYVPKNEYRKFEDVVKMICDILPEYDMELLKNEMNYWSPELLWESFANYINNNVKKDSTNPTSVKIYAILCNCTEDEIRRNFKAKGK